MNRLKNARCYLGGAMDRVEDGGVGWRTITREKLSDLGITWMDPTRKPIGVGNEGPHNRRLRHEAKLRGDFDFVTREMRTIRCVDLRMVDVSDFFIENINLDVHACGTYEELFLGNRQKKPFFIHIEQGKSYAPDWLLGTVPHGYIHSTWDDLYDHVREVAHDSTFQDTTGRWYFFDWMGDDLAYEDFTWC